MGVGIVPFRPSSNGLGPTPSESRLNPGHSKLRSSAGPIARRSFGRSRSLPGGHPPRGDLQQADLRGPPRARRESSEISRNRRARFHGQSPVGCTGDWPWRQRGLAGFAGLGGMGQQRPVVVAHDPAGLHGGADLDATSLPGQRRIVIHYDLARLHVRSSLHGTGFLPRVDGLGTLPSEPPERGHGPRLSSFAALAATLEPSRMTGSIEDRFVGAAAPGSTDIRRQAFSKGTTCGPVGLQDSKTGKKSRRESGTPTPRSWRSRAVLSGTSESSARRAARRGVFQTSETMPPPGEHWAPSAPEIS